MSTTEPARLLELDADTARLVERLRGVGGTDADVTALRERIRAHSPRLSAVILSTYAIPAGGGVSYGHTFVADRDRVAADVAIGYGHGLPRHAGNTATMVAAPAEGTARALPIVGRVAMDDAVVLIDEVPLVAGDHLSVFGPGSGETPLDQWSAMVDDDPVSVLLALDPRITTVVCDDA
ncbi:alanine racemase C-terminal domain-containing protein [Microcella alkaliphila]|uniref:Alanine racemase n=1 Tax=Microcella alkaliphila TaxID=279828 RepID=A0A0U5B8K7_9MICO|nr:alanine racemase C-terminal domain-containing protein [Microcella alkaliphila]BAU32185.1 alanine racemase [Microcella alkaliphila]